MNTEYKYKNTREQGLSTVAIVIVAAVVIGGGAVLFSSNSTTEVDNSQSTTTSATGTEAETAGASSTTFQCPDGSELVANFMSDSQAELTLPGGEVQTVTQTSATSGNQYASADGSLTFLTNDEQEATVQQDGEAVLEGCVITASEEDASADSESTSTAETSADVDAEATTSVESNTEVDANSGVELEVESDTEAEAEAQ